MGRWREGKERRQKIKQKIKANEYKDFPVHHSLPYAIEHTIPAAPGQSVLLSILMPYTFQEEPPSLF